MDQQILRVYSSIRFKMLTLAAVVCPPFAHYMFVGMVHRTVPSVRR